MYDLEFNYQCRALSPCRWQRLKFTPLNDKSKSKSLKCSNHKIIGSSNANEHFSFWTRERPDLRNLYPPPSQVQQATWQFLDFQLLFIKGSWESSTPNICHDNLQKFQKYIPRSCVRCHSYLYGQVKQYFKCRSWSSFSIIIRHCLNKTLLTWAKGQ